MTNHLRPITATEDDRAMPEVLGARLDHAGRAESARAGRPPHGPELQDTLLVERTDYTPVQVSRLRSRQATEGILEFGDRLRSGRPPEITGGTARLSWR